MKQIKSLKTLVKVYFALLAFALVMILIAGTLTGHQTLGPLVAVIGFGAGLIANILAIFVIPATALTLKGGK